MKHIEYKIKKTRRDWIVITEFGHSHFSSKQGCDKLVEFCKEGIRPKNQYFVKAAERILPKENFESLRVPRIKDKYVNWR